VQPGAAAGEGSDGAPAGPVMASQARLVRSGRLDWPLANSLAPRRNCGGGDFWSLCSCCKVLRNKTSNNSQGNKANFAVREQLFFAYLDIGFFL
jgi:hypothetical protein